MERSGSVGRVLELLASRLTADTLSLYWFNTGRPVSTLLKHADWDVKYQNEQTQKHVRHFVASVVYISVFPVVLFLQYYNKVI